MTDFFFRNLERRWRGSNRGSVEYCGVTHIYYFKKQRWWVKFANCRLAIFTFAGMIFSLYSLFGLDEENNLSMIMIFVIGVRNMKNPLQEGPRIFCSRDVEFISKMFVIN